MERREVGRTREMGRRGNGVERGKTWVRMFWVFGADAARRVVLR